MHAVVMPCSSASCAVYRSRRTETQAWDVLSPDQVWLANSGHGPRLLGQDPATGGDVKLLRGPYGYYVELGAPPAAAAEPEGSPTVDQPKAGRKKKAAVTCVSRRSVRGGDADAAGLTLEQALELLQWPKVHHYIHPCAMPLYGLPAVGMRRTILKGLILHDPGGKIACASWQSGSMT